MIEIYVDGSFLNGVCGYGAVILKDGNPIHEIFGSLTEQCFLDIRQVAGELEAVMSSLTWCSENNIDNVKIYYDYKGIECWANGEWKAKKDLTKRYILFIKDCSVKVEWIKVKAHSGDIWNEKADELAKKGALSSDKSALLNEKNEKERPDSRDSDSGAFSSLENYAVKAAGYLTEMGIFSKFDSVYNGMYARIEIFENESKRQGILDIYKTKKKNYTPDCRAFKDDVLKQDVLDLYEDFRKNL